MGQAFLPTAACISRAQARTTISTSSDRTVPGRWLSASGATGGGRCPATQQFDPAIAPDESFVVFVSSPLKKHSRRLFIAFRQGDHWGKAVDLGDEVNADNNPLGPHIAADGYTLYYSSDRSVRVSYPRDHEQAVKDLARLQSWDNGESNIWSVSLQPWLDANAAMKTQPGHQRS